MTFLIFHIGKGVSFRDFLIHWAALRGCSTVVEHMLCMYETKTFFLVFCSLKMCENMNSLAFKVVSTDNLNEKRKTNDSSKIEVRAPSQKEENTLENNKRKKSTKEGDIKTIKGKVFKAETIESSEALTSESMKGQFTKSLEAKDCKTSKEEISASSREDASSFLVEQLCLARDTKSIEWEANADKDMDSPTEEDSDSLQTEFSASEDALQFSEGQLCLSRSSKSSDGEANEAKSMESLEEEDSASSQGDSESSEVFTSDCSDVNASVENAMSSEGETLSMNGTSDGMTYEGDSRSSRGLTCSDRSNASTSGNSSKSPSRKKGSFWRKISKLCGKFSRGMKSAFMCCLVTKQED